jgi:hypothetical protein
MSAMQKFGEALSRRSAIPLAANVMQASFPRPRDGHGPKPACDCAPLGALGRYSLAVASIVRDGYV